MTNCTQIIPEEPAIFHVNLCRTDREMSNSLKTAQNSKFSIRAFSSAISCKAHGRVHGVGFSNTAGGAGACEKAGSPIAPHFAHSVQDALRSGGKWTQDSNAPRTTSPSVSDPSQHIIVTRKRNSTHFWTSSWMRLYIVMPSYPHILFRSTIHSTWIFASDLRWRQTHLREYRGDAVTHQRGGVPPGGCGRL